MRFVLTATGLVIAALTFAAPAAASPSPVPAETTADSPAPAPVPSQRSRAAASPAPVPAESQVRRPVPDGAPQTGGGPSGDALVPVGGALLVAGAATGLIALRRRTSA
ncbi:hypothetical protein [Herbidospora mongoliensis]|uniref:hypothetical protein n=1 Tax=Herbidospora mongoliensis TaxID=688067 RepID=UPI00082AEFE9|nr:hypothetical protein [Herbidospora mongoliensis]